MCCTSSGTALIALSPSGLETASTGMHIHRVPAPGAAPRIPAGKDRLSPIHSAAESRPSDHPSLEIDREPLLPGQPQKCCRPLPAGASASTGISDNKYRLRPTPCPRFRKVHPAFAQIQAVTGGRQTPAHKPDRSGAKKSRSPPAPAIAIAAPAILPESAPSIAPAFRDSRGYIRPTEWVLSSLLGSPAKTQGSLFLSVRRLSAAWRHPAREPRPVHRGTSPQKSGRHRRTK